MRRLSFLLSLILLMVVGAQAQVVIRGRIVSEGAGGKLLSVPGSAVLSLDGKHHAITDTSGTFTLEMPARPDSVEVRALGFDAVKVPIPSSGAIEVVLHQIALKEVEVEQTRNTAAADFLSPLSTTKISAGEFKKAACCNLSESLESLNGVDAQQTDAVSGRRQITMLGLSGSYAPTFIENVPVMRGIFSGQGFGYMPGPWVKGMALTRGPGSVQNGFEGMAGSFNLQLFSPEEHEDEDFEHAMLNGYVNQQGRTEANAILRHELGKNVGGGLLLHGSMNPKMGAMDRNNDGFGDQTWGQAGSALGRLQWHGDVWEGQAGLWAMYDGRTGGQLNHNEAHPTHQPLYRMGHTSRYLQGWAKTGRGFEGQDWKSLGIINTVTLGEQYGTFGPRVYRGDQVGYYGQFLYNTIIGHTGRRLNVGATVQADQWNERADSLHLKYREMIPGAYGELALDYGKFLIMPALSLQYGTMQGLFAIPRLHMRFAPREATTFKLALGRGRRMPAALSENQNMLAAGRYLAIGKEGQTSYTGTQPGPELSWSGGLAWVEAMELGNWTAELNTELFYTWFERYLVADAELPYITRFYTESGARSLAVQTTLDVKPMRRLDVRLGYRFYRPDVPYDGGYKQALLVAGHRAMSSITYKTRTNWSFDLNGSLTGPRRYLGATQSPSFFMMNAQVAKTFKEKFDVYLGAENLLDDRQQYPIINAQDPFDLGFDAGRVWGPVMGRIAYLGVRWNM